MSREASFLFHQLWEAAAAQTVPPPQSHMEGCGLIDLVLRRGEVMAINQMQGYPIVWSPVSACHGAGGPLDTQRW